MSWIPAARRSRVCWGVGLALLAGYLALGLSRITLDVDITRLLPPNLKEAAGYRLFLKNFAGRDELLVTLEGGDAGAVEEAAEALERAWRAGPHPLARRVIWRSPFEAGVDGVGPGHQGDRSAASSGELAEFFAWALLNQPPDRLRELENRLAPDRVEATLAEGLESLATSLDATDRLFGYDPLGLTAPLLGKDMAEGGTAGRDLAPSLASSDGRFRLLYVESARPLADYKAMDAWLADVRAAAREVTEARGVTLRFTGEPAFISEISLSMERDMKLSGLTAVLLICLIVWLGYRDLRLLPVLAGCVGLIFALTLATAGLLSGSLTVLTVGCGSILIGLTVDYGVLMYAAGAGQAAGASLVRTRRGIAWAAATTAASFGALTVAGMPGLAELGLLVTVGVVIGALLFLGVYPRLLGGLRLKPRHGLQPEDKSGSAAEQGASSVWADTLAPLGVGGVVVLGLVGLAVNGVPRMDLDSGSLRPRVSEAYDTLDRLTAHLGGGEASLSVLVAGRTEDEVASRLASLETNLRDLTGRGRLTSFTLPRALWPTAAAQRENLLGPAARLAADELRLREAATAAGFSDDAFVLTSGILARWRDWAALPAHAGADRPFWPDGAASSWLLSRFAVANAVGSDPEARCLCLGVIRPSGEPLDAAALAELSALQTEGVYLAGSKLIGRVMESHLARGFFWLAVIFSAVTLGLVAVALRRIVPFLLTLAGLALGVAALIGVMAWLGISWNSFTLPALLLSLGTGSDYFIYAALELQQHGSAARMRARLLRPLSVCVGASVAGFGSLAWAGNLGLASLGRVCALALALNVLVALFLMPWFWSRLPRSLRK